MMRTAKKLCIKEIVDGTHDKDENGYDLVRTAAGEELSRVRVLATIVDKYVADDKNFASITLDDATETITAKTFKEDVGRIEPLERGDIVDILGDLREYNEEVYIMPRAIGKVDPNWELLRKLELVKGIPSSTEAKKPDVDLESLVLEKISALETGDGVDLNDLVNHLKEFDENQVIETVRILMMRGDLFEPKPRIIKIV